MQKPRGVAPPERDDRPTLDARVAEDLNVRVSAPGDRRTAGEVLLATNELVDADFLLEREHETRADRLDDRRRAALFADYRVGMVAVAARADAQDRPAAGHRRHPVAQQRALGHQYAGGARAADELVRGEEHRVLVGHVDREVRTGRGVVPARKRAVAAQHGRGALDVGDDARDIGRGREAADLQRPVGIAAKLAVEMVDIQTALCVLANRDDVSDRLAPRELVRVMVIGGDEHHRPLTRRKLEDADQRGDHRRRARAAEQHHVVLAAVDRAVNDAPASSRNAVVGSPVADASVWVFAYSGRTR